MRLLEGKALPDTKNVVGTNVIEFAWRLDPRTGRPFGINFPEVAVEDIAAGGDAVLRALGIELPPDRTP